MSEKQELRSQRHVQLRLKKPGRKERQCRVEPGDFIVGEFPSDKGEAKFSGRIQMIANWPDGMYIYGDGLYTRTRHALKKDIVLSAHIPKAKRALL